MEIIILLSLGIIVFISCSFSKETYSREQRHISKNKNEYFEFKKALEPDYDLQTNIPLTKCNNCEIIAACLEHFDGTKCNCGGKFKYFSNGIYLNSSYYVKKNQLI